MFNCKKLFLISVFSHLILVYALECFDCNSEADSSCINKPTTTAVCPPTSEACLKTIFKDFGYKYVFNDSENINIITDMRWDNKELNWYTIAKPQLLVYRKCTSNPRPLPKQGIGCYSHLDINGDVTICVCTRRLCNNTPKLKLNLTVFIIWYSILRIAF